MNKLGSLEGKGKKRNTTTVQWISHQRNESTIYHVIVFFLHTDPLQKSHKSFKKMGNLENEKNIV